MLVLNLVMLRVVVVHVVVVSVVGGCKCDVVEVSVVWWCVGCGDACGGACGVASVVWRVWRSWWWVVSGECNGKYGCWRICSCKDTWYKCAAAA